MAARIAVVTSRMNPLDLSRNCLLPKVSIGRESDRLRV